MGKAGGLDLERFRELGPIDISKVKAVYRALNLLGLDNNEIIELANIGGLSDSVDRLRGENEELRKKVDELSSMVSTLQAQVAQVIASNEASGVGGFEAQVLRTGRRGF